MKESRLVPIPKLTGELGLSPTSAVVQDVVRRMIDGVIDHKLFNAEVRRMKEENQYLTGLRQVMHSKFKDIKLENRD